MYEITSRQSLGTIQTALILKQVVQNTELLLCLKKLFTCDVLFVFSQLYFGFVKSEITYYIRYDTVKSLSIVPYDVTTRF